MESFPYFTTNNNQKLCIFKSKIKIILKLNVYWKVTAEILGREIKYILHFYVSLLLKIHSLWLLLIVVDLYSQTSIFSYFEISQARSQEFLRAGKFLKIRAQILFSSERQSQM